MKFDLEGYIINKIDSEEWVANQRIPTESDLIEISGLSKMSVRKVLERLSEREVLYANQGKGVFVSPFFMKSKINKLSYQLNATKVTYLPSSSKIPAILLKRFDKDFEIKDKNLITFVKLYFVGEEIVAYTINWLNNEDRKYTLKEVVSGKGNIFEERDFNKVINTHRLEETSSADKNILLTDFEYMPTTYSYYIKKNRKIVMMRVTKTKPKFYHSFEIKNR